MSSVTSALSDVAASLSPDELTKKVEEIKAAGNERFLKGDYTQAKALYTDALSLNPNIVAIYSNRAICELKLEQYGLAIADATKAIELDLSLIHI